MDNIIISALSSRQRYKSLMPYVQLENLGTETAWILTAFGKMFDQYPDMKVVDYSVLESMARLKMEGKDAAPVIKLLSNAKNGPANEEQVRQLLGTLSEMRYVGELAVAVNSYNDGQEIDVQTVVNRLTVEMRTALGKTQQQLFKEYDIHELLADMDKDVGLKFRQLCLQDSVKGLMPPMHVAFCSGVDSGKTSFLCDAMTYFAPQCAKLFPGRPIIVFSNEGTIREIWPRMYSAALGKNAQQLAKLSAKELYSQYEKAVGGDKRIIKMLDVHGWGLAQMQAVIEELNPIIVVFDMMANVKVPGNGAIHEKNEQRAQEIRELAAIHDFIAVSTIQLSKDGLDNLYPPQDALKETKIGVQGALDIQIMMGKLYDPAYEHLRGFSTPKNKRKVVGKSSYLRAEVTFKPDICRFEDS